MNNLFILYETYTNGYKADILDIISLSAILCAILVIISKNPIVSVLFLIGLFASISCYLILLGLSFIGLAYLIVYIGAVLNGVFKNLVALVQIQLYKVLLIIIKFSLLDINGNYSYVASSYPRFYLFPSVNKEGAPTLWGKKFYSTLSCSDKEDEEFLKWFVGFSDGESNFTIVFQKDKNGIITGASFRFIIELHKDDINTLKYIKSKLNIGNEVALYGNSCKFTIIHREDINKLISIFDRYNLNTTKYLDYLDFKKAFYLYHEKNIIDKRTLIDKLLTIKNGMNNSRIDFNFPSDYNIKIYNYWLLGLIEGEGSFYLDRSELRPVFDIGLSKVQLTVMEKIKEYLEKNLGFDKYSMFKLKNSSAITIIETKARNNSKPLIRVRILNNNILTNYFLPFLNNMRFITKKGKDFNDLKIICTAVYNGTHRNEEIKPLILKLSYTMNNYRLSSNSEPEKISSLPKEILDRIINAKPTIIHLGDGRQLDSITRKQVNRRWTNCVYEIILNTGEIILASTLNEAAVVLNVDFRTVRRHLDSLPLEGNFAKINANQVRRVPVFYR